MNMFRSVALALAFFMAIGNPVAAQWQTPNHSVPQGRGAGVTGFGSTGPGAVDLPFVGNGPSADSSFRTLPNAGLVSGSAGTVKGSADGVHVVDVLIATLINNACSALPSVCTALFGYTSTSWYGAVCDGVTDDTVTLQTALTAVSIGGKLIIPLGTTGLCVTHGTLTRLQPIHLTCDPGVGIKPTAAIGGGAVINFLASPSGLGIPSIVENCTVGDPNVAVRFGGDGMRFDTTVASNDFFRGLVIRNVNVKASVTGGSAWGLNFLNDAGGRTFLGRIEGGLIEGGIRMFNMGDSFVVRDTAVPYNSTASADNNGIYVSQNAFAGNIVLDHINFTQPGGIVFDCAVSPVIQNSEIEETVAATEVTGALVNFKGSVCTIIHPKFVNNQVQGLPAAGTPILLRTSVGSTNPWVEGNAFATSTLYTPIQNSSTTMGCGFNAWATGTPHVLNIGAGAIKNAIGGAVADCP